MLTSVVCKTGEIHMNHDPVGSSWCIIIGSQLRSRNNYFISNSKTKVQNSGENPVQIPVPGHFSGNF
jgi:hypothetical protein